MKTIMRNSLAFTLIGFLSFTACASKKESTQVTSENPKEVTQNEATEVDDPCANKWGTDESTNRQKFGFMQANYQSKDYAEAYKNWKVLIQNAPCAHKNIYLIGERVLKGLIEKEPDSTKKQVYIDDFNLLYANRIQFFPGNDVMGLKERWARTLYSIAPHEYETINKNLDEIIEYDKDTTDSDVMIYYLNNTFNAFNSNKVDKDVMFETYSKLSDIVEANIEANEDDSTMYSRWKSIEGSLNQIIDKVGTCEDLIKQYKPELPNRTSDASWLNKAEKAMRAKRCTKDPLYISILENLEKVDPSVNVYTRLANYYYSIGQTTKGNEKLQKVINMEPNSPKNSDRYVKMANKALKAGNNSAARSYADKALKYNSKNGYAILIKGNALYKMARASCSGFDKQAAAWIMMEYALRAKAADGRVAGQATRTYNRYAAYKPKQDDIFMQGIKAGQSYTLKCVGVTVTAR